MPEDVVCARIRLQPGSLPRVQEWAEHLRTHRDEALQTLAAEGVTVESVFLDSGAEGDHRAFKRDTWATVRRLDLLVDLARSDSEK